MSKQIVIRCRAIILYQEKLLLVRHPHDKSFAALPGGHLEWGEGVRECLKREIAEELGVEPVVGRLFYVNTFTGEDGIHSVELFFEVLNGSEYANTKPRVGSHAHELAEIIWANPTDNLSILPRQLESDFREGTLVSDEVRYI